MLNFLQKEKRKRKKKEKKKKEEEEEERYDSISSLHYLSDIEIPFLVIFSQMNRKLWKDFLSVNMVHPPKCHFH
jgi:hypothetical protein